MWLLDNYCALQHHIMKPNTNKPKARSLLMQSCKAMALIGNTLAVIGCFGIVLGILGVFDMAIFSFGLSSGVRIIGSLAIAGCLLSAIGYGVSDYASK